MSQDAVIEKPVEETVTATNPFATEWKSEPSVVTPVAEVTDPAIAEKDIHIKEDKPESTKPDEPDKIPAASPKPIQERPNEVKEDIKPATEVPTNEIKFANEDSEKIFNLLKDGKNDEVLSILSEQKKLKEVDKLPAADIIKLNLQYQHKDFTQSEINDLFEENYSLPKEPVQGLTEDDDDFKDRQTEYTNQVERINRRIERDAKPAMSELIKLQKEIVLPDLPRETPKQAEPTQEELQARQEAKDNFLADIAEVGKTFTGYNTTFKDEEVEIKAEIPVSEDDRKKLTPILESVYSDIPQLFKQLGWATDDGAATAKLIEDLHLITNKEEVLSKIASEIGNKRFAEAKKSIKNIDYSGKTQSNGDLGGNPQEKQAKLAQHFFES